MRIAVLGAGSIGSRHVKNLTELGHTVNVYDPHIFNNDRDYLIEWAEAVVIATPTSQHAEDICSVDDLGKPMFVEKPLVGQVDEWSVIPTDHIKMVGYNLRFHSCVKKARELMGIGRIGRPIWARFTCAQYNDRPEYLRDGVVLNWSHEIDLAIYLLGVATFKAATVTEEDDMADIALTHERSKCQTVIHLDYLTKPERRGFMIVGEDGAIEADLVHRNLFLKDNKGKVVELFQGRDSWDGNYLDEMRKFIDRLNGKETIGCTAAEALLVNGICFQAKGVVHVR
jgi:predicted dehydrogenase